jgi:hypothetical protein
MFPPGVGLLPGGVNGLGEDDPRKYFLNILADYKPGEEPLTPAAAAMLRERMQSRQKPKTFCTPLSVPLNDLLPEPFKIVQTPGLRVNERFHRRDFGHMEAEITIVDPKIFTKPVTVKFNLSLLPDTDVMEAFCAEGEQDLAHLPGK